MEKQSRREIEEWRGAVQILKRYDPEGVHMDDLLERSHLEGIRWLIMEVFRQWLVIEHILDGHLKRTPRPVGHAILRLAVAECLNREADIHPKIVHHAVDTGRVLGLSKAELGFLNGVLRSILRSGKLNGERLWASHPKWLTDRWTRQFGKEAAEDLLCWNQSIPAMTIRCEACPAYAQPTSWEGFFTIEKGRFGEALEDLESGKAYIQDPFTRLPVELLDVQPGDCVMDLCAAPGGKSRLLAEKTGQTGRLVLVDKPGKRLERLKLNARHFKRTQIDIIGSNVQELETMGLPVNLQVGTVDAVLIDVPCSNTGVIQKRPDVKVRLKEETISRMADQQLELLVHAARWLRPGGRLVYSTCSIEEEENTGVVERFLMEVPGWKLEKVILSQPWKCQHDGGGAFLLTKSVPG